MTAEEVIKAAMRKITVVASGESPTPAELADGLSALQSMLRSWAGEKIVVFASVKESKTLVVGTYEYTWGTGGTINSLRPNQVLGAYIEDSGGTSHSVDIISENVYRSISTKANTGRPYLLFPHYRFPLVYVYLYPSPAYAETLNLDSLKPFTETSSFDALTSTLSFPLNYEEAIIYGLALRLASEFGKAIPVEVAAIASSSYAKITTLNAANQVESVRIVVPASSSGAGYNINSDSYR